MTESQPRLMLVDDYEPVRTGLARRLRKRGFEVVEVAGGLEVMPLLEKQGFDLLLLDLRLPDLDGLDVLRAVRGKFSMADLPIIMLSARDDTDVVVETFRMGANDYVTKPPDFDVTLARIKALLARKELDSGARKSPMAPDMDVSDDKTLMDEEPTAQEEIPVGTSIGAYTIVGILGRGGMGIVYEAEDSTLDRRAAVKVLHRRYSVDKQWTTRFRREAQAAARVEHPNVVGIYNIGMWQGHHYISMQLITGETAAAKVRRKGRLPWREATELMLQACRGLAAAHARGVIHRDIKPENIMVGDDGTVKLLDFGLAAVEQVSPDDRLTLPGMLIGTPHFMSPEQCRGQALDARSDVYQMGATYFYLLTGRNPYHQYHMLFEILNAHCAEPPPEPQDAPDVCRLIIRRAMAKDADARYPTAQALLVDLEAMLTNP